MNSGGRTPPEEGERGIGTSETPAAEAPNSQTPEKTPSLPEVPRWIPLLGAIILLVAMIMLFMPRWQVIDRFSGLEYELPASFSFRLGKIAAATILFALAICLSLVLKPADPLQRAIAGILVTMAALAMATSLAGVPEELRVFPFRPGWGVRTAQILLPIASLTFLAPLLGRFYDRVLTDTERQDEGYPDAAPATGEEDL